MKIMKFNHSGSMYDSSCYDEVEMDIKKFVEELGEWMSSGQGPSSWGIESLENGWKGAWFTNSISKLTPEEKKEVWKELNSPEPMEIEENEYDGGWSAAEIKWFADTLGVKIAVTKATWKEVA